MLGHILEGFRYVYFFVLFGFGYLLFYSWEKENPSQYKTWSYNPLTPKIS